MKAFIMHLFYMIVILCSLFLYQLIRVGCPMRCFFGIPCPTCGMTRSLLSLLKFDIRSSLAYNPMTVFIIIAAWLGIHKRTFKAATIIDIAIIVAAVATFIVYLFRIFPHLSF